MLLLDNLALYYFSSRLYAAKLETIFFSQYLINWYCFDSGNNVLLLWTLCWSSARPWKIVGAWLVEFGVVDINQTTHFYLLVCQ